MLLYFLNPIPFLCSKFRKFIYDKSFLVIHLVVVSLGIGICILPSHLFADCKGSNDENDLEESKT